jgi:nucleotide-binding universal stress UspA family protein
LNAGHPEEDVVKNIMVATDGSESAAEALDAAIELARQMGAKLHVLAVRPPRVSGHAGASPPMTEIEEIHGSQHIADAAVERARAVVDATGHVSHGPVADCIVRARPARRRR